ncbi:MAG TPA: phosphatase PAP2 family protein [Candidatus Dormibacteraeota bacterium]|nr:phosphatase PAP2 family protein [Candidatus Dormibacteraeota bacterium]
MSAPLLLRISDSGCATSPRVSLSSMAAITLSQRKELDGPLLGVALAAALAAAVLALYIAGHPYIPEDAAIERGVQSTSWGPLVLTFPVFSFIGDAKGAVLEAIVFVLILVFNRRAWILAAAASLTALWYVLLNHLVNRPRPTTAQVLQVTEHPGASSFPSGHTMFIVTLSAVLMLGLGRRFLPRRARPIGWALVVLIVAANAVARVYVGAHWPTDVIEAILVSVAWLTVVASVKRISDRALADPHGG